MKKKVLFTPFLSSILLFLNSCSKDKVEVDMEYPAVDITGASAFPKSCSNMVRGQTFVLRAKLTDNVALGSASVDIHHNFDQHTHSTEIETCTLSPIKAPIKPFVLIQSYPIPAGNRTYQLEQNITIPPDVDTGNYHFMIRLTDKEGWQTIKRISINIH